MDKREFTVIENKEKLEEKKTEKKISKVSHQTNPIAKKFLEFQKENIGKFSVKDLFKG